MNVWIIEYEYDQKQNSENMLFTLQHIHTESLCSTGVEIKIQLLTVSVKLSSEDAASISNVF